jgi:hypothetical protein
MLVPVVPVANPNQRPSGRSSVPGVHPDPEASSLVDTDVVVAGSVVVVKPVVAVVEVGLVAVGGGGSAPPIVVGPAAASEALVVVSAVPPQAANTRTHKTRANINRHTL